MAATEEEYTETSVVSEDEEYEVDGNLKTSLVWDAGSRQLCVALRQFVSTKLQAEVKYKGVLNTVTGAHQMRGQIVKTFQTNRLSLQDVYNASRLQRMRQRLVAEGKQANRQALQQISSQLRELKVDPDSFLPGGWRPLVLTDWILCPGLTFDNARPGMGLRPSIIIKKAPQVLIHSPRTDLMLSAKSVTDFEPGTNKMSTRAGIRLKLYKFNVTSKQDLKVSVGLDMATYPLDTSRTSPGKNWSQATYLKISENNTSVKWQNGTWSFCYTL